MSEAKGEVEYVIKTGRQIVEKKQVDQPEQLNTQIDAVKLLYNELGAQVPLKPNTHRRRDSTRQLRRVGDVYWALFHLSLVALQRCQSDVFF